MLDKAEAASPVDAVEAVTRELGIALGASTVSFLIADLSGRALVRLTHATGPDDETTGSADDRREDDESASVLPLDGGPVELGAAHAAAPARSTRPVVRRWGAQGPLDRARAGDRAR